MIIRLIIFIGLQIIFSGYAQNTKYIKSDAGIFIENRLDTANKCRYTEDNAIYIPNRTFYYRYTYCDKDKKQYYYTLCPKKEQNITTWSEWEFVPADSINDSTIIKIKLTTLPDLGRIGLGNPDYHQTVIRYQYLTPKNGIYKFIQEETGVIENAKNVWIHPPRQHLFKILELNPFPYIRAPYRKNSKWKWHLHIGKSWGDERWKIWEQKLILIKYKYQIIATDAMIHHPVFGDIACMKIIGKTRSVLGKTALISYFSFQYGFVRLEYQNIDNSTVTIELDQIEKQ